MNIRDTILINKELLKRELKHLEEQARKYERKETAKEILELLVPDCKNCDKNWHRGCLCLRSKIAEKIIKNYGVDLGEENGKV